MLAFCSYFSIFITAVQCYSNSANVSSSNFIITSKKHTQKGRYWDNIWKKKKRNYFQQQFILFWLEHKKLIFWQTRLSCEIYARVDDNQKYVCCDQGSCGSLKVFEFFSRFSRPVKSLKTGMVTESLKSVSEGSWKCLNLIFYNVMTEQVCP